MKTKILLSFLWIPVFAVAQSNMIPNGGFETGPNSPGCQDDGYQSCLNCFDDDINNWKVAQHNNDKREGTPDWIDFNTCGYLSYCSGGVVRPSNRFIAIKADLFKCKEKKNSGCNMSKTHEAVAVGLENNQSFSSGINYIIRYKIIPVLAENLDNTPNVSCCFDAIKFCHLRVFLSKLGHLGWDQNNSDKQELLNANYASDYSAGCDWIAVERHFTCTKSGLKNLILYAESGGFIIDDVEIFEECIPNYLIQNRDYFPQWYFPGSQGGLSFAEKSGDYLIAGNNVGAPTSIGPVKVEFGSAVTYTASNKIVLKDGFIAQNGSAFKAVISPCPNSYKLQSPDSSNYSYTPVIKEAPQEISIHHQMEILPNPSNGRFSFQFSEEDSGLKQIIISDVLGSIIYREETSKDQQQIDLSSQARGIYFVKVNCGDKSYVEKVIIR